MMGESFLPAYGRTGAPVRELLLKAYARLIGVDVEFYNGVGALFFLIVVKLDGVFPVVAASLMLPEARVTCFAMMVCPFR
jgi:hypothetical protein